MKYLVLLFYCGILSTALGQDIQFSQYYNNPLYSNPGFAGTGDNTRAGMSYRSQWVNIDRPYTTYGIWADHFIVPAKSGIGFSLFRDGQGETRVRSTELMVAYSYVVSLGNNWVFRPGLNVGFGMRDVDYYRGVFGDQIDNSGTITGGSSDPILQYQKTKWYPDFGGGGLIYNESFWFGISMAHLNTPNQSLAPGINSELPIKTTIQAGYKYSLVKSRYNPSAKENSITPSLLYKQQGNFHQLDIGVYYTYEPIMFGVWYRGIPGASNTSGLPFSEAVIPMVGYIWNGLSFTYSYDYTISKLTNRSSAGSHEISLIYEFRVKYRKGNNIQKSIPCPKFHRRYQ